MMWYWNNKPYSLAQIAQGSFEEGETAMQTAWAFVQAWQAGKEVFVLPTSGSTGEPKPIEITRTQMQASARATGKVLNLAKCKTALLAIPAQYVGGKMMLVRALEFGWGLTGISPVGNPLAHLAQFWGADLPTFDFIALVPAQLHNIITETPELLPCLNRSRAIILGGGAVGESLEKALQSLTVPVYNTYGMTETVSHIALRRLNGQSKSKFFQAFPDVQLDTDERDCLRICGEVTKNEWIQTNDVVKLMPEFRTFVWLGRADNIINSGGIKIQIEALETKIEAVLQARNWRVPFAVAGLPDEKWQNKIVLFLETTETSEELLEALRETLKTCLPKYEVPKEIRCLPCLPRTETGKIRRDALK